MCNNKGPMFISPISFVSSRPAEKSIGSLVIGYVTKTWCQNVCNVVWIYGVTHSTPHTPNLSDWTGNSRPNKLFYANQYLLLWLSSIHTVQTQLCLWTQRVWGSFLHARPESTTSQHSFTIWVMKCVQHSCFIWIKVHQLCFNLCWWCTKGRLPTVCCRRLIQPVKYYKISPRT
jgi:hypothetical protein